MTAVLVQFKPTLLEQESALVNDVISSSSRKRSASPSPDDDDDSKQESHKRIKTDQEKTATTASGVEKPTTT